MDGEHKSWPAPALFHKSGAGASMTFIYDVTDVPSAFRSSFAGSLLL